jgi:hypothetical protein
VVLIACLDIVAYPGIEPRFLVGQSLYRLSYRLIYCDVHAVVLFRGNKGGYLVTTNGCFLGISSEKVSSLRSVPRLYISDNCV